MQQAPPNGTAYLTDNAAGSAVQTDQSPGTITIEVDDLFTEIAGRHFDIIKIDIEGGEYPLMDDPRFDSIPGRIICMQSHPNAGRHLDETGASRFVCDRLSRLGYAVSVARNIIWALPK